MRVFFLTTELPWPPHQGGRVRTLSQLRLLAAQPEVTELCIFSLTEGSVTEAERRELAQAISAGLTKPPPISVLPPVFHPIHIKRDPKMLLKVLGRRLRYGEPYLLGKWQSQAVTAALRTALSTAYDVVYIDHLGMGAYLPIVRAASPRARVVLEEHNVESDMFAQLTERLPLPLKPVSYLEHRAAARAEAELLSAVDAVVAISETDAQGLTTLASEYGRRGARPPRIEAVPPVVESSEPARTPPSAPRLCYVGSLTWHPNVLGLDWFCAEVLPELRRLLPEVTVRIAGSGLPSDAAGRPLAPSSWQVPNVEVVGFVPDLETLYRDSAAMIAPIAGGSGVRIKLLEALRAGMPVVTTRAGAAGLPLQHGVEVLIADDPAGFARAARDLLHDRELGERLRRAGYRFLAERHAPRVVAAAMRRALGLPS